MSRTFGAYRKIGYQDDGITKYACMDCKNTFYFGDDPAYYNFCPKCGMSWFKRFECREHGIPRWYFDRHGNEYDHRIEMHPPYRPPTRFWAIESRSRFKVGPGKRSVAFWDEWHKWKEESRVPFTLGSWRDALRWLNMDKARSCENLDGDEDWIQTEFRVRIVCS